MNQENKTKDAIVYSVIESDWPIVKARMRSKIVEKLRVQTEKAKEKLEEEGLLEAYNKEREGKSKKVVKVKQEPREEEHEDDAEERKLFEGEEEVDTEIEQETVVVKQEKKQKKRPTKKTK